MGFEKIGKLVGTRSYLENPRSFREQVTSIALFGDSMFKSSDHTQMRHHLHLKCRYYREDWSKRSAFENWRQSCRKSQ